MQNIGRNLSQDDSLYQKTLELIEISNFHLQTYSKDISKNLEKFSEKSQLISDSLSILIEKITIEFISGVIESHRVAQGRDIIEMSRTTIQLYAETAHQYLTLVERSSQIAFKTIQQQVDLVFYARKLELDYVHDQLTLLQTQESHELTICLKIHTQKLKEEAQKFNEIFQIKKLENDEKEREFRRDLAIRQQQQQELYESEQLKLQEQAIYNKHKERMCQLHIEKDRKKHQIDSDARCRIAEAKARQENCSLM
jgi:hypothetical protein